MSFLIYDGTMVFCIYRCGHCKALKPDWDKLGKQYKDSGSVLIVDVDCTADGQQTCQQYGVKGYPTLKYFLGKKANDYQGARDFNALSAFVAKTLDVAKCNPLNGKNCAEIEKKFIAKLEGKSSAELQELLQEKDADYKLTKTANKEAEKQYKEQQKSYRKATKLYDMASNILKAKIKAAGKQGL